MVIVKYKPAVKNEIFLYQKKVRKQIIFSTVTNIFMTNHRQMMTSRNSFFLKTPKYTKDKRKGEAGKVRDHKRNNFLSKNLNAQETTKEEKKRRDKSTLLG